MNQFLKTYIRARRIAEWYKPKSYELNSGLLSDDELLEIVKVDGDNIKYIDNPIEEVQLAAVEDSYYSIRFIIDKGIKPSEEVQLAAVTQYPNVIELINNPTEKVQLVAVEINPYAIEYIENPSEEVQMVAVTKRPYLYRYIKNPTDKVKMFMGYYDNN